MKWKDTGEIVDKEESSIDDEHFDEEKFSPWADRKGKQNQRTLLKMPVLLGLLVIAIVALVIVLLILLMNGRGGALSSQQLASFDRRLQELEDRLDKFEAIDEKVTRIWEQAKSFEKFKDRFDRSEASTSLRMDHLTMSLEALQKQIANAHTPATGSAEPVKKAVQKTTHKVTYHQVQPGDTLYSISKKYNLSVDQLLQINQMKPGSVIQPGQKLIVKQPSQ